MAFRQLTPAFKVEAFSRVKRHGDITRIAEETGYSKPMVSRTLNGQRNNITIVNKAYRLVKDRLQNLKLQSA